MGNASDSCRISILERKVAEILANMEEHPKPSEMDLKEAIDEGKELLKEVTEAKYYDVKVRTRVLRELVRAAALFYGIDSHTKRR